MVFILRQLFNKSHFTKRISFIFSLNFIFQSWLFLKLNINASTKNWNKSNPTSTDRHILIKNSPHFSKSLLTTIHLLQWKIKNQQDSNFSSNNCQQDCNEQDCNTCTRLVPCTVKKSNPLSILTTANNNNNNN